MKVILMSAMLIIAAVPAAFGQVNGSFENGTDPGLYLTVNAGENHITGWSVDFGSVDYIGSYWVASEGVRSIDLNGNEPSQISQAITTIPGITYQLTFDMSGNPDGPPPVKLMTITADGSQPQQYSYDMLLHQNTRENMMWESYSYYFRAADSSTLLRFTSDVEGFYGGALDNISIVAITAQVCHRDRGKPMWKTIIVGVSAVPAHLAHGDTEGPCQQLVISE